MNICKKFDLKQLNSSQESTNTQKISQNSSPGKSDRCGNNFVYLDHQDNALQRSLQSFQANYYLSLRNGGIYR